MESDRADGTKKPAVFSYEEFLNRLIQWAQINCGITVTDRMVRDWCEERVIPGPIKVSLGRGKGFRSHWDALAYRRACRICRFKSQGVKYFDELQILLWLFGAHVNIKDLRRACLRTLKRLSSSQVMNTRSNVDLANSEPSARTVKAFENGTPNVDSRLVPEGFAYSGRERLDMLATLRTGETRTSFAESLANALGIPEPREFSQNPAINLFKGIFAPADETTNSGQFALESAESIHFKTARTEFWKMVAALRSFKELLAIPKCQLPSGFDPGLFVEAYKGLLQPNFKVANFVALVCAIQRKEWPQKNVGAGKTRQIT